MEDFFSHLPSPFQTSKTTTPKILTHFSREREKDHLLDPPLSKSVGLYSVSLLIIFRPSVFSIALENMSSRFLTLLLLAAVLSTGALGFLRRPLVATEPSVSSTNSPPVAATEELKSCKRPRGCNCAFGKCCWWCPRPHCCS